MDCLTDHCLIFNILSNLCAERLLGSVNEGLVGSCSGWVLGCNRLQSISGWNDFKIFLFLLFVFISIFFASSKVSNWWTLLFVAAASWGIRSSSFFSWMGSCCSWSSWCIQWTFCLLRWFLIVEMEELSWKSVGIVHYDTWFFWHSIGLSKVDGLASSCLVGSGVLTNSCGPLARCAWKKNGPTSPSVSSFFSMFHILDKNQKVSTSRITYWKVVTVVWLLYRIRLSINSQICQWRRLFLLVFDDWSAVTSLPALISGQINLLFL